MYNMCLSENTVSQKQKKSENKFWISNVTKSVSIQLF